MLVKPYKISVKKNKFNRYMKWLLWLLQLIQYTVSTIVYQCIVFLKNIKRIDYKCSYLKKKKINGLEMQLSNEELSSLGFNLSTRPKRKICQVIHMLISLVWSFHNVYIFQNNILYMLNTYMLNTISSFLNKVLLKDSWGRCIGPQKKTIKTKLSKMILSFDVERYVLLN